MQKLGLLIFSIVIVQLAGAVGAIFTSSSVSTWYAGVNKPVFNPPNWIFGPVWTMLFLLMGIALYLVLVNGWGYNGVKIAVLIFTIHFALNILWSFLFFGLQNPFFAFIEIIILAISIILTMYFFYRVSPPAMYLLIPYIFWVSFASILNFSIWRLN